MKGLIQEVTDIPKYAKECFTFYTQNPPALPTNQTTYIGMGSSYFAPLTLYYCGVNIRAVMASEEFYYRSSDPKKDLGVVISQSGESSESVWALQLFKEVFSLTNTKESTIAKASKTNFQMLSGVEECSSTKTYMNTLVILYCGFKIDISPAIDLLEKEFSAFSQLAQKHAKQIQDYAKSHNVVGRLILGSGPNYGTALQGALTMSETTKQLWAPLTVAAYDHGPKECSENTIVVILNGKGADSSRIESVKRILAKNKPAQGDAAPLIVEVEESRVPEKLTPFPFNLYLNLLMNFISDELYGSEKDFSYGVGSKVTLVE